jgi:large subunit ribosomal protein L6
MSRVGKLPVIVPEKVEVTLKDKIMLVKGPLGQLKLALTDLVNVKHTGSEITVTPSDESKSSRAMWGTTRSLLSNMVTGVSTGFKRVLEFNGVGYKASVKGKVLVLNLGYSHPIDYQLPEGISAKVNKNVIELSGVDKEALGQSAAKIRSFRPPEPYKGKGIKYLEETIVRKAGKTGAK